MKPYGYVWTSIKDCMETRFTRMYPNEFYKPFDIVPVYTHPVKELTDKLDELLCSILGEYYVGGEKEGLLAEEIRAILRKAQEK